MSAANNDLIELPCFAALLELVHETENDDLTNVVQKVICLYCEQVIPYAVEITQNLVGVLLSSLKLIMAKAFGKIFRVTRAQFAARYFRVPRVKFAARYFGVPRTYFCC